MPGNARVSDILSLHANVSRRVRNLETGVHPVTAEADYYESTDWTAVTLNSPWENYNAGATTLTWMWKKRSGICTMRGGIKGRTTAPTTGTIGTIPASQAPEAATELQAMMPDTAPYRIRAVLHPDGTIELMQAAPSSGTYITFDSVIWTPA